MDRKRLVVSLRRHVATIGLLFAAAQGWGAALLIYPVMGIALAIPAALVGLVAGIADTWQRRQS